MTRVAAVSVVVTQVVAVTVVVVLKRMTLTIGMNWRISAVHLW